MKLGLLSVCVCYVFFPFVAGCKKLIVVPPPVTQLSSDNVYDNNSTASAVLTGIYTQLSGGQPTPSGALGDIGHISLLSSLSADELTVQGGNANTATALLPYYQNALIPGNPNSDETTIFSDAYRYIHVVNLALEKMAASKKLTPGVRQQLIGEAEFLRAFFYFYLVNLYGDIPLTISSDYEVNSLLARIPQAIVYAQIKSDLINAQTQLTSGYVASDAMTATSERLRPNKWAATALLARIYLYNGKYDSAELEAGVVISNSLYDTVSLNGVFLKNSKEAIWQLQPVNLGWNTNDARVFALPATGPTSNSFYPVYLNRALTGNFEPGDQRRTKWIDSVIVGDSTYFFPFKYKSAALNAPVTEYEMVLRLGEQYLIRAEARARENNFAGACADLNMIRVRAGLPAILLNDQSSLLSEIMHERRVELFTEWGQRWLDLKRSRQVDAVMGFPENVCTQKGGSWNSDWQWYPIPAYDLVLDPNLKQNDGY